MKVSKASVLLLLQEVSRKSGYSLDGKGFMQMESLFSNGITQRYLKEQLYEKAMREDDPSPFRPRINNLDTIAKYLNYADFNAFERAQTPAAPALSRQAESLVGNYWSIVRCNSGQPDLLISSVSIKIDNNQLVASLQSPVRLFEGPVDFLGDNVFITLDTAPHKRLHVVLKIGNAIAPKVIQGVFSGINSGGMPIAGRELFVRQDFKEAEGIAAGRVPLASFASHPVLHPLATYFAEFSHNNLRIKPSSRFDWTDL